jgi:hypothetical protein
MMKPIYNAMDDSIPVIGVLAALCLVSFGLVGGLIYVASHIDQWLIWWRSI